MLPEETSPPRGAVLMPTWPDSSAEPCHSLHCSPSLYTASSSVKLCTTAHHVTVACLSALHTERTIQAQSTPCSGTAVPRLGLAGALADPATRDPSELSAQVTNVMLLLANLLANVKSSRKPSLPHSDLKAPCLRFSGPACLPQHSPSEGSSYSAAPAASNVRGTQH